MPFTEEGNGHRRRRFIRMMKRNTGNREKMWAGHTAPFFACRKVISAKSKKARKGPFHSNAGQISVRVVRSCSACHPTRQTPEGDPCAR
ncbi:hypothetical protein DCO47_16150 [Pseudomonas sp. NDM]|nr:hypothetical protein DCO47_16150 [Pseudomonas sp. NDM]